MLSTWLMLVAVSFGWNHQAQARSDMLMAFETARAFFKQILVTRQWNAEHGGVYVQQSTHTPPNPHISIPNRDLSTREGLELTLVNPAYMTRQIAEIAKRQEGIQFHITSLKPVRPQNRAEDWEREWLKSFEKGFQEQGAFHREGKRRYFRYMAALITQESCLVCHQFQGYALGDIRGGISVTLPMRTDRTRTALLLWHVILALVGSFALFFLGSKLDSAYRLIHHQATMDALTGVANRRALTERLKSEYKRSARNQQSLVLIMCDIDGFKNYNDHFGHIAGDRCLVRVAGAIKESLNRSLDFCARYGGEEFVVLLPQTDLHGGQVVAERIRSSVMALQIPQVQGAAHGVITVSAGVAMDAEGFRNEDFLIEKADRALYMAKQKGRNRVELSID